MSSWLEQVAKKGVLHWIGVFITVAAGLYVGHRISDARLWLEWRYAASHAIQRLAHRVPIAKYTTVVTIGSREYWNPPLSARAPIRRDYLANLVDRIAQGNPFLIALDFDMRSPQPDGVPVEIPEFEPESRRLIAQLRAAAQDHHVILPRTIWNAREPKRYRLDSDVWSLAPDLLKLPNVHSGYIALPPDLRQVPLAVPLVNFSDPLDSFSLAIAKARAEDVTDLLAKPGGREDLPFASYIPEREFPVRAADDVLTAERSRLFEWFNGRLVLVGGAWNALAAGRGPRVDTYLTPAGVMPGVFIHANFVEALLDQRTFEPAPEWVLALLEIVLVLICVVALGLDVPSRTKLGTCAFAFVVLVGANYVALQNMGRFFDFSIPLVVIVGHVALEQIGEWRHQARAHRRCSSQPAAFVLTIMLASSSCLLLPGKSVAQAGKGDRPIDVMGPGPVVHDEVESADPAKPGGGRHVPDSIDNVDRPIDTMGPGPVVGDEVESVEPLTTGGARIVDPKKNRP